MRHSLVCLRCMQDIYDFIDESPFECTSSDSSTHETHAASVEKERAYAGSNDDDEIYDGLVRCMKLRREYIIASSQHCNPQDDCLQPADPPLACSVDESGDRSSSSSKDYDDRRPLRPKFDVEMCAVPPRHPTFVCGCGDDGVFRTAVSQQHFDAGDFLFGDVPDMRKFFVDLEFVSGFAHNGPSRSFCYRRLKFLECEFEMYALLNESKEFCEQKKVTHRDFYNIRKNDGHIHHSACMNLKHLLRFIKAKLKTAPKDVVIFRDGKNLTLEQVFESLNLSAHELSIDTLDMHAHKDSFHRFDQFNLKYNPIGESRLREIFLKTDNFINGKYLAEITKEVIADIELSKYQMAEYRISIYGRSANEWTKLAAWVCDNAIFSPVVRWIVQFPRLYAAYRAAGVMGNFQEFLHNAFAPLFAVTLDPQSDPKLHIFLCRVVGFDTVDDESKVERRLFKKFPVARDWNFSQNPPYAYYMYYLYANVAQLNRLRRERRMNTFAIRQHSGEAGDPDHLCAAFLGASSICHGVLLRKLPTMQYLYYLMQIGIAISPLSNNALFLAYDRNPFYAYFKRGLNISLSTDDPLQFHFTREPLIEEYSIAAQIYKLSSTDLGELCRNSVLQSGFELCLKKEWIGANCTLYGPDGNDFTKTNVPPMRLDFREKTLRMERNAMLSRGKAGISALNNLIPSLHSMRLSEAAAAKAAAANTSPDLTIEEASCEPYYKINVRSKFNLDLNDEVDECSYNEEP